MKELKRLFQYIKAHRKQFIWGFLFVTISNLGSTYAPRIVGQTIDKISNNNFTMEEIYWNIAYILGLIFVSGFFMVLTRRTIIVASREVEYEIRKDLIDNVQSYSMSFYHENSTGSLMAHATNDIPASREFIGPAIMYSANTVTTFIFALYFMFSLSTEITLIGLIPLPLIAYGTYILGKKIHVAFKDVQEQFGELTTKAQESISGVRVVRAYVREMFENSSFGVVSTSYLNKYLRLAKIEAILMPSLMVLIGLSQISVLGYGGYKVIQGTSTIGELTQFFIYLNLLIWPVAAIGWVTNLIQRASASAARLGKLMDRKPDIEEKNADESIDYINGDIKFEKVGLAYKEGSIKVLENIDLNLSKGMTLGVIGGVGSGKSSLANLIPRLYEANEGKIEINGKDIKQIPLKTLRSSIGIVPQDSFLFSTTILENIRFGVPEADEETVIDVSKKAQLHDEVLSFDDGYETILGERGVTLSGGQKQRVAIARAMLKDPEILILDDSLSALDAQTEEKILRELKTFMQNRTTIIISHRISSVKDADLIITLDDGKIIEKGRHDDLVALNGIYARMYNRQKLEEELEVM